MASSLEVSILATQATVAAPAKVRYTAQTGLPYFILKPFSDNTCGIYHMKTFPPPGLPYFDRAAITAIGSWWYAGPYYGSAVLWGGGEFQLVYFGIF